MIPIRLTLKGLYSYREEAVIDFERLTEQQLFGIFGAVGSGKSTILEAITYVLYGQTERLNLSGDNRNYNMLNLRSSELFIELEFMATVDGREEQFQFGVKQKRNSKSFEVVSSPSRWANVWADGEWKPLETTDASGILKLSYENFIKTIIIPQGKFQEFLGMGATARTRMLREIFALDRFELDRQTRALLAETKEALVRLEEQLRPLEVATDEAIAAKAGERLEAEAAQAATAALETQQQAVVAAYRATAKVAQDLQAAEAQLAALATQEPAFARRKEHLAAYQSAVLQFQELLNNAAKAQAAITEAEVQAQRLAKELGDLTPQAQAAQDAAERARTAFEGRHTREAQVRDLAHLRAMREAQAKLAEEERSLEKGNVFLQAEEEKSKSLETNLQELTEALVAARSGLPDIQRVHGALRWHEALRTARQRLTSKEAEVLAEAQQVAECAEKLIGLRQVHGLGNIEVAAVPDALAGKLAGLKLATQEARNQKEELQRRAGLAAFATQVLPGEPCPLCGATDHPQPFDAGGAAAHIAEAEAEVRALEAEAGGLEAALQTAAATAAQHATLARRHAALLLDAQALAAEVAQLQAEFAFAPYPPDDEGAAPKADEARFMAAQKHIGTLEQNQTETSQQAKASQALLEKARARLQEIRDKQTGLRAEIDTRKNQLTQLGPDSHPELSVAQLQAMIAAEEAALAAMESAVTQTQAAFAQIEKRRIELTERAATTATQLSRATAEHAALQSALAERLAASKFPDLQAVHALLAQRMDTEAENKALDAYFSQLQAARTRRDTLAAQVQGQTYDAAQHQAAEDAWNATKVALDDLKAKAVQLRDQAELLQNQLTQRRQLKLEQDKQLARQKNLQVLERMFKASGFVKYVSTIYLQELVARADARFKRLTRNALSLELGDDLEFQVRDMLNGGQTRSVKTLSGGQTFQASLCLALALAENVQQHSGSKHNFFFLDEGFGTLDRESLSTVFDALKQLRLENRIVGVISHVEELQQEIDVYLKVTQTEERGSIVRGSWE